VLFINDIIEIFSDGSCACKLFSDDVNMYATLDVNDDCKGLFDKLKSVEKWCSEWHWQLIRVYQSKNVQSCTSIAAMLDR